MVVVVVVMVMVVVMLVVLMVMCLCHRLRLAGGCRVPATGSETPPTVRCLLYNGRIISIVNIQIIRGPQVGPGSRHST